MQGQGRDGSCPWSENARWKGEGREKTCTISVGTEGFVLLRDGKEHFLLSCSILLSEISFPAGEAHWAGRGAGGSPGAPRECAVPAGHILPWAGGHTGTELPHRPGWNLHPHPLPSRLPSGWSSLGTVRVTLPSSPTPALCRSSSRLGICTGPKGVWRGSGSSVPALVWHCQPGSAPQGWEQQRDHPDGASHRLQGARDVLHPWCS